MGSKRIKPFSVPQDVSWFDDPKNTTGALTTRLANDAAQVKGVRASFLWVFVSVATLNLSMKLISSFPVLVPIIFKKMLNKHNLHSISCA